MSFDYCFAYENRRRIHTARWSLGGVKTLTGGNTRAGRVWLVCRLSGQIVTAELYKHPDCESTALVASGTADVGEIDSAPARCDLAEENSSSLSGQFDILRYAADPDDAVEVLVSLCDDSDLADEHAHLADLPVRDSSWGMARYCAVATRKALLLASQLYAGELGGYGAPEHRYRAGAGRNYPDFRRLANPDQLKDAAVHWALALAFGACHQQADETMYSRLRDYHDAKRREAVSSWSLTFNLDPDGDADADRQKPSRMVNVTRL